MLNSSSRPPPEEGSALTPLNVIRTENVLSRFPAHNLSKKGKIDIQIVKRNSQGEVEIKWEVSYNDKHGQARQLAYKLDTIVINRRIEEEGRPIPKLIRLGKPARNCRPTRHGRTTRT